MKTIPLLLDKPLDSIEKDQFGHEHYADILYDLITNDNLKMPYNIGLLGKWGVGKSSIKEICKKQLDKNKKKEVYTIDFNAWKYGGESIKRALLREIYKSLGGLDEHIKDKFSRQITKQVIELCNNQELRKNIINVLFNWVQIIGFNLLLCYVWNIILPNVEYWGKVFSTIPFVGLSAFITKELLNKNNMLIPVFQNITKVDLPDTSAEVYEEFLKKQLPKYKKKNPSIKKVVVFVDDIDRLPTAQEMIDCINAIRAFMDFNIEENNIGFVFVVSCCEYKISDALMSIKIIDDKNLEPCVQQTEAKRFLDKIFHFRIDIPPFPYRDMIDYSKQLLETQISDFEDFEVQLINIGTDLEDLLCRLIYPNVQNPRQAIQILNTFFQSWNIATRRESEEMAGKAGGLAKGIVTNHPLTLAVLSVLKVDFPYFYKELLLEPKLLSYILEVLRVGKLPKFHIDLKIRDKFLEVSNDGQNNWKLKSCFYDLNQYLNLINNKFELPTSLKPFLMLNQNLLSRKYGEQAYEIEEALIHNSYEKLLKILNVDNNKLSVDNAKLIKSVYESLSYNLHKENAFSTIVKLIPFISNETRFLIDSFADTLYKHNKYREILSVIDYKNLLYAVSESKINKVIDSLNKTYRTKFSYDTSSDEDKKRMNMFKGASDVLLEFYGTHQNYVSNDFCKWIISPVFASENDTEGEDFDFGFKYTFNAFRGYDFLYKYASVDYVKTFINEFIHENSFIDSENKQDVLNTVEKALDYILGNDSKEFGSLLSKFIYQENTDLFNFIIDYTNRNIGKLSEQNINEYLRLLATAIEDKISDNFQTEFEIPMVIEIIKSILSNKFTVIKTDNYIAINRLCLTLIKDENYLKHVIEIIGILKGNNYSGIDEIENVLIENLFEFESEEDFKTTKLFLFTNYNLLSENNKILLSQIVVKYAITEDVSSHLEENIEEFLKEYAEIIKINPNTQIINNLLNATYELTENNLIPNENSDYFDQLKCLLPLYIQGNQDVLKDLICAILNDEYFSMEFCKTIGEIVHEMGNKIWENDNRIVDIFNRLISEDNNSDYLDCAINIFMTISVVHTDENLRSIYKLILENNYDIADKAHWLLKIDKIKAYTADELVSFREKIQPEENIESVVKIWRHFLDLYDIDEREKMLSNTLFETEDARFFKSLLESIHMITNEYEELNSIVNKNSIDAKILKLLPKRPIITDMLIGEDRKKPSRTLLLNTKILYDIDIENKLDLIRQMLQWAYDLYNDILRDTEVRGFQQEVKELINTIFKDKTFGKIKLKK